MREAQTQYNLSDFFFGSGDGTKIAAQMWGNPEGEVVLLINSCASRMDAFLPALGNLGEKYHFIGWDYRSLFASSRPIGGKAALRVEDHAADALALLELQTDRAVKVIVWGTGVQIAVAMQILKPACFSSIVVLAGNWQKPISNLLPLLLHQNIEESTEYQVPNLKSSLPRLTSISAIKNFINDKFGEGIEQSFNRVLQGFSEKTSDFAVQKLFDLLQKHDDYVSKKINKLMRQGQIFTILQRFGICQVNLDQELFNHNLKYLETVDWYNFWELVRQFEHYDALQFLDTIDCPVLLVNGSDDSLSAKFLKIELAKQLKNPTFLEFERVGHFILWEKTDQIAELLVDFWN